jgi:phage recombination protein Bet
MEKTTKKEVKKAEKELDKAVEEVKDIIVVPETPMVPHDFKTKLTRKQIEVIKEQFAKGASDTELQLFLYVCQRTGLDPFSRQIHLMPRWNSKIGKDIMMVVIGIDGLRSTAERTGAYAGNTDPVFGEDMEISVTKKGYNGSKDTVTKYTVPSRATVTVKKVVHGLVCDFPATAKWTEYYPGDKGGMMWIKMPENMLGKCLPNKARIQTDRGSISIGKIVREKLPVKVRSLNEKTGEEEWRKVTNWFRNGSSKSWVSIKVPNGTHAAVPIKLTGDHEILGLEGWVEASSVKKGNMVSVASRLIEGNQRQIIMGTLMGDGSLSGRHTPTSLPHLEITHSIEQREYTKWISNALKSLSPTLKDRMSFDGKKYHPSIRMTTKSFPSLLVYRYYFYKGRTKIATPWALDQLDDLGVAVWIMDDGNISFDNRTISKNISLRLYTCAFSLEEHREMLRFFKRKYGAIGKITRPEKNPYLSFGTHEAWKILEKIEKYIDFRSGGKKWVAPTLPETFKMGSVFVPVASVKRIKHKEAIGAYDIEVEHNHNFMYNNVVVHNCAEAKALRKAFPSVMSGLYVPEEMQQAIVVAGDETPKKPEERNYDKASRMIALIMNIPELKDIIGKIQGSTKYTDDQKVKLTAMIDKRIQELTPPPVEPKVEGEEAIEELESGI